MVDLDFVVQLSDLCSKILTTKLFSKPHGNTILTNHLKLYYNTQWSNVRRVESKIKSKLKEAKNKMT
jgi:hypothetical protein